MGVPDVAAQPGAGWDEEQCTAALAHLEQLQAQVRYPIPLQHHKADILRSMTSV
jgi:hypothetical protein